MFRFLAVELVHWDYWERVLLPLDASIITIVGPNGSGKTTLEKLIAGLYQASSGTVLIDGIDSRQLDPAELRRNIGNVSQDVNLFFGSLRDNIVMSAPHVDDAAVLEAVRLSGLSEFVNTHPAGLAMPAANIGVFRETITRYADTLLGPDDLKPRLRIDQCLGFREINGEFAGEMTLLAPFGAGNPRSLFEAQGVEVVGRYPGVQEGGERGSVRQVAAVPSAGDDVLLDRQPDLLPVVGHDGDRRGGGARWGRGARALRGQPGQVQGARAVRPRRPAAPERHGQDHPHRAARAPLTSGGFPLRSVVAAPFHVRRSVARMLLCEWPGTERAPRSAPAAHPGTHREPIAP